MYIWDYISLCCNYESTKHNTDFHFPMVNYQHLKKEHIYGNEGIQSSSYKYKNIIE
jgi:hypothetical protein